MFPENQHAKDKNMTEELDIFREFIILIVLDIFEKTTVTKSF